MPSDVSKWTLASLRSAPAPGEVKGETSWSLTNAEKGQSSTGNAAFRKSATKSATSIVENCMNMSTTMKAGVAAAVVLIVGGIVTLIVLLATMGGGFYGMHSPACSENNKEPNYIAVGFPYGSNAYTLNNGDTPKVMSDLLYFYHPDGSSGTCAEYSGDKWVPLHLTSNETDSKPSLPDDWGLKSHYVTFGDVKEINEVKSYPVMIDKCHVYYKAGEEKSTNDNLYTGIATKWPVVGNDGNAQFAAPRCDYAPPPSPPSPPPSPPVPLPPPSPPPLAGEDPTDP